MSYGQRHCESRAETRARQAVVPRHAVQCGASALIVGRAHRTPLAAPELPREVELRRIDRVLLAGVTPEIVVVLAEEARARAQLDGPHVQRLGQAELRLRRPAVGAE